MRKRQISTAMDLRGFRGGRSRRAALSEDWTSDAIFRRALTRVMGCRQGLFGCWERICFGVGLSCASRSAGGRSTRRRIFQSSTLAAGRCAGLWTIGCLMDCIRVVGTGEMIMEGHVRVAFTIVALGAGRSRSRALLS